MSYYHTCPICGANLDPGERCDCKEVRQPISDQGIFAFDMAQNGDCPVLTIGRHTGNRIEILNCYYNDEATEMYNKLVTQAPEGKVKTIL